MHENQLAAGALLRTVQGELTALPRPPSWRGRGCLPPSQEPQPRCRPFGPRASAHRGSSLTRKGRHAPQHDELDAPRVRVRVAVARSSTQHPYVPVRTCTSDTVMRMRYDTARYDAIDYFTSTQKITKASLINSRETNIKRQK